MYMANHITLRLSWHSEGWNGHICKNPKLNTYCVGNYSYPGDMIKLQRDLEWESQPEICGKGCSKLDKYPACSLSINAFGGEHLKSLSVPPVWFNDKSEGVYIDVPPATACVWPYEVMYGDDVLKPINSKQKYDYDKRLNNAKQYFNQLKNDKSLIFYYANYSNPFSEEDSRKYVIIGISRLKNIGDIYFYKNVSDENKAKYAGGFVWQMPVTSNYPDEGFSIPYNKYMDKPDVLEKLLVIPDNNRNFKYATRYVDNDDALSMVEKFLEVVNTLIEIKDDSQDWTVRKKWLLSLLEELWKDRGAYPGIIPVLSYLNFESGINYYKNETEQGRDKKAFEKLKELIEGKILNLDGIELNDRDIKSLQRNWKLKADDERFFLLNIAPRIDIRSDQLKNILSIDRLKFSLYNSINEINKNPYLISENYIGNDVDDYISFNKVDHGILPSPQLGLDPIFEKNSPERFRALCVNQLKRATTHTFISSSDILNKVNNWLEPQPDWKKETFTQQYFQVDKEFLEEALRIREKGNKIYLYLKYVYEDERLIQNTLEEFVQRRDIDLRKPVAEKVFEDILRDNNSQLFRQAENEYLNAISKQAIVCKRIFNKPLAVLLGSAGTGKTTLINAIIKNIEREPNSSAIYLMAPTGKAAERIKEKTGDRFATTIHSFLASHGWLNDNFTLKRTNGNVEDNITTLIIDECSMIDLELFAALFRAINWNSIKRLILVGDPNQLPPIGRGRVFAEIIEWLSEFYSENLGKLEINIRQMENKVSDQGNGILNLASLYIQDEQDKLLENEVDRDNMIEKLQEGGKIDKDLEVIYWEDNDDLDSRLKSKILDDLEKETGLKFNAEKPHELWSAACKKNGDFNTSYQQVISPFRSEYYGVEHLNTVFQSLYNKYWSSKITNEGVALFDKVIQIRNRPKSNPISAYNKETGKQEYIEIYNGELGVVKFHGFDNNNWKTPFYLMEKFQVIFNRKEKYWVGYGKMLGKDVNNKWIKEENTLDNLELGYVISVHKAQGSDFERVYFILPQKLHSVLSMELMYTAITRAKKKLTVFVQGDVSTFLSLNRKESSSIQKINSSLFTFDPLPEDILTMSSWYEEGKIVSTLSEYFVRSKSEMNIANILALKEIPFKYEVPLYAPDGTMFIPDFTISYKGETYYWEHVGRLDLPKYKAHWEKKEQWYNKHFPNQLITTFESEMQSKEIDDILKEKFDS